MASRDIAEAVLLHALLRASCCCSQLGSDRDIDRALVRYRRQHRRALAAHHWLICDYATGRPLNRVERLLYTAGTRDEHVARAIARLGSRMATPQRVLTPGLIARAGWMSARVALTKTRAA